MKKIGLSVLMVLAIFAITLTSCTKPYMKPIYEEVGPNETAFLVALEGNAIEGQAKMDSLEFYEKSKVQSKRIEIPQRWMKTGKNESEGHYVPTMKLIKVDRSPVTRLWYNEGDKIGDKAGINVETKGSVGVTFGVSLSARLDEADTAKYLYYYSTKPLAEVMDKEIYASATSILGKVVGTMQYDEMIAKKGEIVATLQSELTKQYAQFGIAIYGIGLYGGIIPDNPGIQKALDDLVIAERAKAAAAADNATARIKAETTAINSAMADVDLKKALADYIRAAGEKGISLVPQVMGAGSTPLIDLTKIGK